MKNDSIYQGKIYEIDITGFSHLGEGIGRLEGFAVFVPDAIPGEKIKAQITEIKKNYAKAKLEEVISSSTDRIVPRCDMASICGGCSLQHIKEVRQLELKRQVVVDSLQRIGGLNVPVQAVLGMNEPWRYRNKGNFHIENRDGRIRLGFYEQGSHAFVPAVNCYLFSENINRLVEALEKLLTEFKIPVYNRKNQKGFLRSILMRESSIDGEMMLVFITASSQALPLPLLEKICQEYPKVVSIYQNIKKTASSVIFGREFKLLKGKSFLRDAIGHVNFKISPQSFFQVNSQQTKVLYDKVLEYAELSGSEKVVDAYCGIGSIALYLAGSAAEVYGIESVEAAIQDAKENASLNNISNAQFVTARVEKWLPEWVKKGGRADVIVVDPPRKGCDPQTLEAIVEAKPPRVVYVSCNPATLARDLKILVAEGFEVKEVQPVDMFGNTSHVECVIGMQRKDT